MSELTENDRVLVDASYWKEDESLIGGRQSWFIVHDGANAGGNFCVPDHCIHPHPGVDVAALLEELELANALFRQGGNTALVDAWRPRAPWATEKIDRLCELRTAREAAKEPNPELKRGDEAWIRAEVFWGHYNGEVMVHIKDRNSTTGFTCVMNPDDIVTEKP